MCIRDSSYTAVNYYLYADKEIERGNDSQKLTAGCDYLSVSLCRKQVYKAGRSCYE